MVLYNVYETLSAERRFSRFASVYTLMQTPGSSTKIKFFPVVTWKFGLNLRQIVPGPKPLEKPTWGETSDSPRHGLHVNSLLGFV